MLIFEIPGEPKGKGRPRFTRTGHAYTPQETAEYEERVRLAYKAKYKDEPFAKGVPLKMEIAAYFTPPKRTSKTKRAAMLNHDLRPMKKPDGDNIIKIIADALNGVAYYDDAQLVEVKIGKFYSEEPKVFVILTEVDENDR